MAKSRKKFRPQPNRVGDIINGKPCRAYRVQVRVGGFDSDESRWVEVAAQDMTAARSETRRLEGRVHTMRVEEAV